MLLTQVKQKMTAILEMILREMLLLSLRQKKAIGEMMSSLRVEVSVIRRENRVHYDFFQFGLYKN